MSKAVITESSLSDIGDAIREQLGVSTEYLPSQMGAAVRSISGGGTTDYTELSNKPQINSVELSGNKSSSDLGLQDALSFDASPTSGSTNPVTSGGVYTALTGKVNTSAVGSASGVAELDENGHVPSSQLPSYVDDVIEGYYNESTDKFYADSSYTTEIAGEAGKIYITLDTNLSYRWSGTGFVVISPSLALGETSSTAYRGDRGATAYSTSQTNATAITSINNTLGSTSISSVGDGTVTGAISSIDGDVTTIENTLGNTSISGVGDGTVTGAISTLNSSISTQETPITTSLTPASVTVMATDTTRTSAYVIRAGVCFVSIYIHVPATIGDVSVAVCNLPDGLHPSYKPPSWTYFGGSPHNTVAESLFQNGILYIRNAVNGSYSLSFSYPVT